MAIALLTGGGWKYQSIKISLKPGSLFGKNIPGLILYYSLLILHNQSHAIVLYQITMLQTSSEVL